MDEQGDLLVSRERGYVLTPCADQEWLDAINIERKKEQLNPITYETFEIIMDRLEKEYFDLVRSDIVSCRAMRERP